MNIIITYAAVTSSGSNTAGESYSLKCTVTVTGSVDQPTITWLDPMDNIVISGVVTTGSASTRILSTLILNPLTASHAGRYTCRIMLGSAMGSASTIITVQSE